MSSLNNLAFGAGRGFAKLNKALIVLIPKRSDALHVSDYRPISLPHSFAKLFAKLLANRVCAHMPELVQVNQSAFIQGRCLHDNFLLMQAAARKLHCKKVPSIFLKIDIAKAFDSLCWPFLFEVRQHKGFGPRWRF